MKAPKPITSDPAWIVGAFDGPRPHFLCQDKRRNWVVVFEPHRAMTFPTLPDAHDALAEFIQQQARSLHGGGGVWRVYEMTTRTTFKEP